ncbi:hypothetical protein LOD99_4970 [Oopsacas minuta]|uniref:THUMP domain-containing protein n=1 Tax=Oopsacas minuta TaxID=111878 RepID=A0AAV7JRV0_9METZ|nr:hypothetical protein LOD99_4970 [Oopsacas minuta]
MFLLIRMSAESSASNKQRKRKYYDNQVTAFSKRRKQEKVTTDMRGILISCNSGNEAKAVREAYDLCNEYYKEDTDVQTQLESNSNDLSEQLKLELDDLKSEKIKEFQSVDSGAKHFVFIQCNIDISPRIFVERIFRSFIENKISRTRFIMRFIPISHICRADIIDIKKTIPHLLNGNSELFHDKPTKYKIFYQCRNNAIICRSSAIELIILAVEEQKMNLYPDYSNPEFVIIVEVIASKCFIGLVRYHKEFSKYNLNELNLKNETQTQTQTESKEPVEIIENCVAES